MEIILTKKFQIIEDDFDPLRKRIAFFAGKAILFSSTRKTLFFADVAKLIAACTRAYFSHFSNQCPPLKPFKPGARYSKKRSFSLSIAERISTWIEVAFQKYILLPRIN